MRFTVKWVLVWVFFGLTLALPVRADEIADQIKEGLTLYEKGDLGEAVTSLSYAIGQIQQKQALGLKEVFPEPLKGWKAEEASTGNLAPMALLGGGVAVSRHYFADDSDKTVDIEMVSDSPLLQSILMFTSNPAVLASQPGAKLIKVKEHKGIQKFSSQDKEGEINLVVRSRMLISIKGDGLESVDDLVAYANAIHFEALAKFLEK
jgi:hypothetical protein